VSFGEANREWQFRLYRPEDKDAVVAIFAKQGLKVRLPLPDEDAAVAVGIVGLRNGVVKMALFSRATVEEHLVIDPDEPGQSYAIKRAAQITEGAIMQLSVELAKLKFPIFVDGTAYVPKSLPNMIEYLREHLGFVDEGEEFVRLYKKVGY
jgi:hypothetical protein